MNSRTSLTTFQYAVAALLAPALFLILVPADAAARQRNGAKPRASTKQQKTGTFYSCPMHADVKSAKAGRCPKCGMDLRLTHEEAGTGAAAHDAHAKPATPATSTGAASGIGKSKMSIPDLELLDQDGKKIHFYSDLVKGKVVAINFIFTTCTTICPPLGATFARVQRELGEQTGRDVHFISISVDPTTDTPERLKAWGAKFKAGAGWTFVTGGKQRVDELLSALAASSANREDHSPTVLIGNDATGQWTRTYGLAKPSRLVQIINDAVAGRLETSSEEGSK